MVRLFLMSKILLTAYLLWANVHYHKNHRQLLETYAEKLISLRVLTSEYLMLGNPRLSVDVSMAVISVRLSSLQ